MNKDSINIFCIFLILIDILLKKIKMENIVNYLYENNKLVINNNNDNKYLYKYKIKINKNALIGDNYFINALTNVIWNKILDYKYDNIYICSLSKPIDTNLLSIISFKYNLPYFILNRNYCKKGIIGNFPNLIQKDNMYTIVYYNITLKIEELLKWINCFKQAKEIIIITLFNDIDTLDDIIYNKTDIDKTTSIKVINLLNTDFLLTILSQKIDSSISKNFRNNTNITKEKLLNKLSHKTNILTNLYSIVNTKNTNICVSIEHISNPKDIIKFTNLFGPHICILKINTEKLFLGCLNFEIFEKILDGLNKLKNHYKFLIFDSRNYIEPVIDINKNKNKNNISFVPSIQNLLHYLDLFSVNIVNDSLKLLKNIKLSNTIDKHMILDLNENNLNSNYDLYLLHEYNKFVLGSINTININQTNSSIIDYKQLSSDTTNIVFGNYSDLIKSKININKVDILVFNEELYTTTNPVSVIESMKLNNR